MPFVMRISDDLPEEMIGEYDIEVGPDQFVFKRGDRLEGGIGVIPLVRFTCSAAELSQYDCLWTDGMVPLVNVRLRIFLERMVPDGVQFFDAIVLASEGEVRGYFILNIAKVVEMIDVAKSKYARMPGADAVLAFDEIRIRADFADGMEFGREASFIPYKVVGIGLAEAMRREGFTGFDLVALEDVLPR